jgi:hypothetical protein
MKAKALIERLQGNETATVYIHDAETDDDLPVGQVEMPYGHSIVLHVKGEDDSEGGGGE